MNTVIETCPPLEDIAAFLDGKLSEAERTRVVAHLADCSSCYAVFAGAARFQLEEKADDEPRKAAVVVPLPRRNVPLWTAAAALAAFLLIGLALIPRLYRQDMPVLASAEIVPPGVLANKQATTWSEGNTRGVGESSAAYKAAEFLVGVHLVDLHLTLSRKDVKEGREVLVRIHNNLQNFILPPEEAQFYDLAQRQILAGRAPSALAPEAAQAEASLTKALVEAESLYLEFGKWAEAGRLSSLTRQPAYFETDQSRRFLQWLLSNAEKEELDSEVVQDLQQIRDLLEKANPPRFPYDALARRFTSILRHYEAESRSGFASSP